MENKKNCDFAMLVLLSFKLSELWIEKENFMQVSRILLLLLISRRIRVCGVPGKKIVPNIHKRPIRTKQGNHNGWWGIFRSHFTYLVWIRGKWLDCWRIPQPNKSSDVPHRMQMGQQLQFMHDNAPSHAMLGIFYWEELSCKSV